MTIDRNPIVGSRTASPVALIDPDTGDPLDPGPTGVGAVIDVTLSTDTGAYTDGDVLADTQEVAGAVREDAGSAILESVSIIDRSDQKIAMDLLFFRTSVSLGTENSAPSISDADAGEYLGRVYVAVSDYIDLGGVSVATLSGIGLVLEAGAASTSVYVAAITRGGTPTYAADALRLRLGLMQ